MKYEGQQWYIKFVFLRYLFLNMLRIQHLKKFLLCIHISGIHCIKTFSNKIRISYSYLFSKKFGLNFFYFFGKKRKHTPYFDFYSSKRSEKFNLNQDYWNYKINDSQNNSVNLKRKIKGEFYAIVYQTKWGNGFVN